MSKARQYECPTCKRVITLYVKPSTEPVCHNPQIHSTQHIQMKQIAVPNGR